MATTKAKKTKAPKFGELVRSKREELGLSYRQAAEESGVDKAAIQRAETGIAPTIENFASLCRWAQIDANVVLPQFSRA